MRTWRQRKTAREAASPLLFVRPLNQLGVRYIISGSVAAILYARDIRSMLAVSGDQFDRPALEDWIRQRGLETEWRLISS